MIAYFKTEIPFLRLVLLLILGIIISIILDLKPNFIFEYTWLALFLIIISLGLLLKKKWVYLNMHMLSVAVYLTVFLTGIILCNQKKEIHQSSHFSKHQSEQLIVNIKETPKIKGDIARFEVAVKYAVSNKKIELVTGNLLIALRIDTLKKPNLNYGDELLIYSKYTPTEAPYNPGEFNYKRFLSYKQVYHQSFINQQQVFKIDSNKGISLKAFALEFRAKQVAKFNKYLSPSTYGIASTLILGDRADLGKDIIDTFTKTGTMHVLSVSGMHVALVVYLFSAILFFLNGSLRKRYLKAAIIIFLVWFYALITGLAPSIVRAAIMISLVVIAKAKLKQVNIFNILSLSAFILLLYNPFNIVDVGFQLSYLAVAGLIYIQPKIGLLYQPNNKIIKYIWDIMAVSIAAQIATAPISLFYFHQFPIYFVLSNIFIVIPAMLIMYIGIGFLVFSFIKPLAQILGLVLDKIIDFNNYGLKLIEEIPNANITQIWFSVFEIIVFYLFIIFALKATTQIRFLKIAYMFLFVLVISISYKKIKTINQKQVTFFSLRKNTAVAFIKGNNAVLITDLSIDENTFKFSVKPYLDSCQIDEIQLYNPHLTKNEKIIKFEGKTLKIINQKSNFSQTNNQNWLLLSGDYKYNLAQIIKTNKFNHLFIDSKNRDFIIKDLQEQSAQLNIKPYILKKTSVKEFKL
jgi:competence protein ComEC